MDKVFSRVSFRGTFRSYQQEVLDEAAAYLADGRIHIVAAPGSGKTVLGLELIRRTGAPTLILSPTVTVRRHLGNDIDASCGQLRRRMVREGLTDHANLDHN